jgi:prophage DNA circulation protein
MSKDIKSENIELRSDDRFNLKNVLEMTINFMEIAENMQEVDGEQRKEYVIYKMKKKLGMLYDSYSHEINTIIESVIFMTKLGRVILINDQNIKKACSGCFKF